MPITLGTNIASLRAQRELSRQAEGLSRTFERLASGSRINRASDDAAGLAIASNLNSNARVFGQGIRNFNDGLSLLNIASGALEQLSVLNTRLSELSEQAANGTYSSAQRTALNLEGRALVDEYNRIIATTKFNSITLLDGSATNLRFQGGFGIDGSLSISLGSGLSTATGNGGTTTVGSGTFNTRVSYSSYLVPNDEVILDLNGDSKLDLVVAASNAVAMEVYLGNGNGTFKAPVSYAAVVTPFDLVAGDFDEDGNSDIVVSDYFGHTTAIFIGNGNGTFKARVTYSTGGTSSPRYIQSGDFNGDGDSDLVVTDAGASGKLKVLLGNGNGTFKAFSTVNTAAFINDVIAGDFNGDSRIDIAASSSSGSTVEIFFGQLGGTLASGGSYVAALPDSVVTGDFNADGINDLALPDASDSVVHILMGNSNGTFKAAVNYTIGAYDEGRILDINGDGNSDIALSSSSATGLVYILGNGNGTFKSPITFGSGTTDRRSINGADFNADGAIDIVTDDGNNNTISIFTAIPQTVSLVASVPTLSYLDLSTASAARQSLDSTREIQERISAEQGAVGAIQSRIDVAVKTLSAIQENSRAAEARILDADMAQESASSVRFTILQNATSAVLAQANLQPGIALNLLNSAVRR